MEHEVIRRWAEVSARASKPEMRCCEDHKKTASVRDLRYDFPRIESLLSEGEEIQITKRRQVIARLVPEQPARAVEFPDFRARRRAIFGDDVLEVTGAELIRQDRDRF